MWVGLFLGLVLLQQPGLYINGLLQPPSVFKPRGLSSSTWDPGATIGNKPRYEVVPPLAEPQEIAAASAPTLPADAETSPMATAVMGATFKFADVALNASIVPEAPEKKERVPAPPLLRLPGGLVTVPAPAVGLASPFPAAAPSPIVRETPTPLFPCGDGLDRRIFSIFLPAMLNYVLIPLTGAVDCFWVGKMKNALALAGQSGANQMFASAFFLSSFLPAVVSPLVASARNNSEIQDRCHQALWIALSVGSVSSLALCLAPTKVLSLVLPPGAPALQYALPYLRIRALTLVPALLSTVAFAVFRGTLDIVTPLRISIVSNLVNIVLDPIFIFQLNMGVSGAALATCVADVVALAMYMRAMLRRRLFDFGRFRSTLPTKQQLLPLLSGGLSIQARALAIEFAFLTVSRATQTDTTGFKGAAHAVTVQLWQLGSVVLLAMSTAGSTLVPVETVRMKVLSEDGKTPFDLSRARAMANRVMVWGGLLGTMLGLVQLCALPLVKIFTAIPEVQAAARAPVMISALLQVINGVTFTGEGIQQGNRYFGHLAASTVVACMAMGLYVRRFGHNLVGVWGGLVVLYVCRMLAVLVHHFKLGPLAPKNLRNRAATRE